MTVGGWSSQHGCLGAPCRPMQCIGAIRLTPIAPYLSPTPPASRQPSPARRRRRGCGGRPPPPRGDRPRMLRVTPSRNAIGLGRPTAECCEHSCGRPSPWRSILPRRRAGRASPSGARGRNLLRRALPSKLSPAGARQRRDNPTMAAWASLERVGTRVLHPFMECPALRRSSLAA